MLQQTFLNPPAHTHTHTPIKKAEQERAEQKKKFAMNLLVVFCGIYGQIASTKLIF